MFMTPAWFSKLIHRTLMCYRYGENPHVLAREAWDLYAYDTRGVPVWDRWPWKTEYANPHDQEQRQRRWDNRAVLYSPEEQSEILKRYQITPEGNLTQGNGSPN